MGMRISIMMGAFPAEKVQNRAPAERGWPGKNPPAARQTVSIIPRELVPRTRPGVGCSPRRRKRVLIHPGHPVATYLLLRNSLGDSGRLYFPTSPVESGSVRVTSGGVAYVTLDFVEDFRSLRSRFWSWRP